MAIFDGKSAVNNFMASECGVAANFDDDDGKGNQEKYPFAYN